MTASASRAKCHAGASPLERSVRQHCSRRTQPMLETAAPRHWLALLDADVPTRGAGAGAAQSAAIAGGERGQSLPPGGGTKD